MPARTLAPLLIAEDDPNDMFLFTRLVKATSAMHALHIALDGREAIRLLEPLVNGNRLVARPGVAFLDIAMPHVGGFEVLEWIRRHAVLDSLPVVIMSNTSGAAELERAARLRAQCFLRKFPGKPTIQHVLDHAPLYTGNDGAHLFNVPDNLLRASGTKEPV
jgi:CheY-like chemotaxis protein